MRLTAAFVAHETRMRWRSIPFRVTILVYLLLAAAPVAVVWKILPAIDDRLGPATFAMALYRVHPGLTALVAAVLAAGGVLREHDEGSFSVVSLAGMSAIGYFLRRWLAIVAILLPLSFAPVLVALGMALAAGQVPMHLGAFLWPWLLHIGPLCLVASAFGLAIATIAGSLPRAVALFFLLVGLAGSLLAAALARLHWTLGDAADWLGLESLVWTLGMVVRMFNRLDEDYLRYLSRMGPIHAATEGRYDALAAATKLAALMAVPLAITLLLFALAPKFLRRLRPDHRPWRPRPKHPLRTFLLFGNRFRERYAPDPGSTPADRVFSALALVIAILAIGWISSRELHYRELATERYEAEVGESPEPTSVQLAPGRWSWEGSIDSEGRVEGRLLAEMVHRGQDPTKHLAFELQQGLEVREVKASGHEVEVTRHWNRLALEVDPPLEPGTTTELHFELEGRPSRHGFPALRGRASFVIQYERWRNARLVGELKSLARSSTSRATTPRMLHLGEGSLFPIPRYTSYELTEPRPPGDLGRRVLKEILLPEAELSIRLEAPSGSVLVDSCGSLSGNQSGSSVLTGVCRTAPANYSVRGGERIVVRSETTDSFLVALPEHRDLAELHLPALEAAAPLFEQAWPGLQEEVPVGVELPPDFRLDNALDFEMRWGDEWEYVRLPVSGRLVLIEESILLNPQRLEPRTVVARVVESRLWDRRRLLPRQVFFFQQMVSTLIDRRLGLGPETGAVIPHRGFFVSQLTDMPLLECEWGYGTCAGDRMAAVLVDLEHRVGAERLRQGLDLFFDASQEHPGSVEELIGSLEELSGVDLQQFFDDFLAGTALPELSLQSAESIARDRGFIVRGTLENLGTGEAHCPVVLVTDLAPVEIEVIVGEKQTVAFEMQTAYRPQSVELDPRRVCHRYESTSVTLRMDLEGS